MMVSAGAPCVMDHLALAPGITWGMTPDNTDRSNLMPQEEMAISRAMPRRVAEFTGGRVAARLAMRKLGINPMPVPMGADRAPIWPMGVVGSISHSGGQCVAITARTRTHSMLGLDLEQNLPMPEDLILEIVETAELSWLSDTSHQIAAKRVFSVKEAIYKAIYPKLRRIIGFKALRVEFTSDSGGFAMPLGDLAEWSPKRLPFQQTLTRDWIVSACCIPT